MKRFFRQVHLFGAEKSTVSIEEFLDEISLEEFQTLWGELQEQYSFDFPKTVREILQAIINGEDPFSYDNWIEFGWNLLTAFFQKWLPATGIILAVCVFLNIFKNLSNGLTQKGVEKIVYTACYGVIIAIILQCVSTEINTCYIVLEFIERFIRVVFPLLLTFMTTLGASSFIGIYQPLLALFSGFVTEMIKDFLFPLFLFAISVALIGNVSEEVKLSKLSETAVSFGEWLIGLIMGGFMTFTSIKGITGATMDGYLSKGAKSALSGALPIVGNYLQDGMDIVLSFCVVIKNGLGVCAFVLLLFIVGIPFVRLSATHFIFKVLSALTEFLGEEKISAMLYRVANCFKLLIAILLCFFFFFFILIMLVMVTFNYGAL